MLLPDLRYGLYYSYSSNKMQYEPVRSARERRRERQQQAQAQQVNPTALQLQAARKTSGLLFISIYVYPKQ